MPRSRLPESLFARCTEATASRMLSVLAEGESQADFIRAAVEAEIKRRHRDALRAQSDARTGAITGRAPLELLETPAPSKDRK